ncbi:hypothetical protein [Salininema proteolyticum]|uniref:Uncharacterized protein n=1 Tax=Salininema proteolyticum TaxID=1607685 RepID=A0ABV8TW71_9ACTN
MTDEIEKPSWRDDAPEAATSVLGGDGLSDASSWVDAEGGLNKAAEKLMAHGTGGDLAGLNASNSRAGDAQVDSLTDWGGIQDACKAIMELGQKIFGEAQDLASSNESSGFMALTPAELVGQFVDVILALLPPLEDLLQLVTGNEGAMQASADMWMAVPDGASQTGDYINQVGQAALAEWEGKAGSAARKRLEEAADSISVAGLWGYAVGIGLAAYAFLAKFLFDKLKEFISQQISNFLTFDVPTLVSSAGLATPVVATNRGISIAMTVMDAVTIINAAVSIFELGGQLFDMIQDVISQVGEATGLLASKA